MKSIKTYILIAVFILFAGTSVFLTVESVATGSEISSLDLEEQDLLDKQGELKELLVRGASISNLEEKSNEFGFVPAAGIIYINENEGVASR